MPVVPPMVSAATGALLIAHMQPGAGQQTMLYGCYAMFGLSLVASLIIITMIWTRLSYYGTSGTARVPTLWIVLGPLGQSITAAGLLGTSAALAVRPAVAAGMSVFAILYGVPVWGFAVLWISLATVADRPHPASRNAVRAHMVEPDFSQSAPSSPGRLSWPCTPRCRRFGSRQPSPMSGCSSRGSWWPFALREVACGATCFSRPAPRRSRPTRTHRLDVGESQTRGGPPTLEIATARMSASLIPWVSSGYLEIRRTSPRPDVGPSAGGPAGRPGSPDPGVGAPTE